MTNQSKGKVYLVGAGPGDPGLISVRGLDLIKKAEVIVHDQLGAPAFLPSAKDTAEIINVGKWSGNHTLTQNGINDLLVEKARQGKMVVRLKGGDPMIFGRGGEELEVLHQAGILTEVVPGISSTIAGPIYAGISLTHRGFTTTVAFITGHEADLKDESTIPWQSLAGIGTMVFVMGVKKLEHIVSNLIKFGKSASTPAAVIERATTPRQRTVSGTLADIFEKAREAEIKPPALFVVGEVVSLRDNLSWFEKRPLFGKSIVVTRSRAQESGLLAQLEELGAEVFSVPSIRIERLTPNPDFERFLKDHESYQDLVFTSVNGVEGFIENLIEYKADLRITAGKNIVCIGPATANAFQTKGITPDFIPASFVAESLLPFFEKKKPGKVAILRAEKAREVLPESLKKLGFEADVIPLYKTLLEKPPNEGILELIAEGKIDAITFTSSSTVDNFLKIMKSRTFDLKALPCFAIGPVTADTCREHGLSVLSMADEYTIPGLVDCLISYFAKEKS